MTCLSHFTDQCDPSKRPTREKEGDDEEKEHEPTTTTTTTTATTTTKMKDEEELDELDKRVQEIVARVEAANLDRKQGRWYRAQKLNALRSFIGDVLAREEVDSKTGVFVAGDFGTSNVVDDEDEGTATAAAAASASTTNVAEVLNPLALRLNQNSEDIGFSTEVLQELRSDGLAAKELAALRGLLREPRSRALVLTEMVVLSWKAFIVRKLTREFTGRVAQTYAAYKRFVLECLTRVAASWSAEVPQWDTEREYWTRGVKDRLAQLFPQAALDAAEAAADFDLRRSLLQYQLLHSCFKHFHVRLSVPVQLDLIDGRRSDVPESALEECRLPGLRVDATRPARKVASEHLMTLLVLEAQDTTIAAQVDSQLRGGLRVQQTSAKLLCLDHALADTRGGSSGSSGGSPPAKKLAVLNLLDTEAFAPGRASNSAIATSFAITTAAYAPV